MKRQVRPSTKTSPAERYFKHLATQYTTPEGKVKQPASGKFIDTLRALHDSYRPRIDLTACLAGTQPGFRGKVWFWSDLHFFHEMMVRHHFRPFASIQEMNATLMRNCLARVSADDLLVFGGDITMGDVAATNALLRAMPCRKLNVLGNHDIEAREMHKLAVDEVAPCLTFTFRETSFFLTHYPVPEWVLEPGQINLHGHSHLGELSLSLGDGERHINFCVEHTGYAPVSLAELLDRQQ